jgi:ABC-type transport system substrate-binding protein
LAGSEQSDFWGKARWPRRRVLRGAAVGAAGLGLAGCATSNVTVPAAPTSAPAAAAATSAPAAAPTVAPKYGGTIKTIGTSAEANQEPHAGALRVQGGNSPLTCYSTLLTYKWGKDIAAPSYIPSPDLAESWTQPDDVTYIFKLRPGIKWQNIKPVNGRELVADDIVYSYQRIRDLKIFSAQLEGVTEIEAVDKGTLKLTLDKPNPDLLDNLSYEQGMVIVAKEAVEAGGGSLANGPTIGTGAFIFEAFEQGQKFFATRNPDYFIKGQPYVDRFESYRTGDASALVNGFRGGTLNIVSSGMSPQAAEDIRKTHPQSQLRWLPIDRSQVTLGLHQNEESFKDARVRQAISKALDRKAMIDTVWLGHANYQAGLSLPSAEWVLPQAEMDRLYARDVEGAKRLLREAGKASGLSFELMTYATASSGAYLAMSELAAANLKEVGIDVKLAPLDTATATTRRERGQYQAYLLASVLSSPSASLYGNYYSGGPANTANHSNPTLDKLVDQQAVIAKDPEARKKILMDIQRMIVNDAVYIPLLVYHSPAVSAPEIRDFYPPLTITAHHTFWNSVWIDK